MAELNGYRCPNCNSMIPIPRHGNIYKCECCGSGSTLRATMELGRPSYGFEIDRDFYNRAKNEMLVENYGEVSMRAEDKVTGQQNIFDMLEVLP